MMNVKAGDEVRVFDVNGARRGWPAEGHPGTVIKVGRKLVTVKYSGYSQVFRLDTGRVNDRFGHQWIETPEEAALKERRARAVEVLLEHHIELGRSNRLTVEQIEALAEVARDFS